MFRLFTTLTRVCAGAVLSGSVHLQQPNSQSSRRAVRLGPFRHQGSSSSNPKSFIYATNVSRRIELLMFVLSQCQESVAILSVEIEVRLACVICPHPSLQSVSFQFLGMSAVLPRCRVGRGGNTIFQKPTPTVD